MEADQHTRPAKFFAVTDPDACLSSVWPLDFSRTSSEALPDQISRGR